MASEDDRHVQGAQMALRNVDIPVHGLAGLKPKRVEWFLESTEAWRSRYQRALGIPDLNVNVLCGVQLRQKNRRPAALVNVHARRDFIDGLCEDLVRLADQGDADQGGRDDAQQKQNPPG